MSAKLLNIKESIVTQMSRLAAEQGAIDLTQGFPELKASEELIELVHKYMLADNNQYAPNEGILELRKAISIATKQLHQNEYNPETEITITAGATEAIYSAITAFVDEDNEVIIFEPSYDTYSPVVRLNGGKPIYVKLQHPNYAINWEQVKMHITARTRMIIINTPHTPTGRLLTHDDFEMLSKIVANSNIVVLSDEVYEHLVYPENTFYSISMFPKLAERSIVVNSFGKMMNITGWKVGYALAPENLTKEIRKIHRFVTASINKPVQYAIAEHLSNSYNLELGELYSHKRNFFSELIEDTKFKVLPSEGTFFLLLDYSRVSTMKDSDFANHLTTKYGVACVPMSEFYHQKEDNKVVRICFAKSDEVLKDVALRLTKVV